MHYHVPKPFYRKSRDTWYVEVDGRQINLGRNRDAAFQRYHEIMAVPEQDRRQRHLGSGSGMRLTELFDRFLDWVQQHRSPDTLIWYQYRLQRFAERYPGLTFGQLKPFHFQEWVDTYKDHSPTTTLNYMRCLKRCLKRVTMITDLLTQGVPLEDVQDLAGHADPRTTRLYDGRRKSVTRNIVERISI